MPTKDAGLSTIGPMTEEIKSPGQPVFEIRVDRAVIASFHLAQLGGVKEL
jgi:hypothetical protein